MPRLLQGNSSHGFSLIELSIGLVLSTLIALAAYRFVAQQLVRSNRVLRLSKSHSDALKFLDRITIQLNSAFAIPDGVATKLGNRVSAFLGTCHSVVGPTGPTGFVPHSLVALPYMGIGDFDLNGELTVCTTNIDTLSFSDRCTPPVIQESPPPSDAIRVAFVPENSRPASLIDDVIPVSGFEPIVVSPADAAQFSTGDFAMIYDNMTREVFRITSIEAEPPLTPTRYLIHHDGSISFWNLPFGHSYFDGVGTDPITRTPGIVQRVEIHTYAHDVLKKVLSQDRHLRDDHFEPENGNFMGGPGRVPFWEGFVTDVKSFQVKYETVTWNSTSSKPEVRPVTRTPVASYPDPASKAQPRGNVSYDCFNGVGYPGLRLVDVELVLEVPVGDGSIDRVHVGPGPSQWKDVLRTEKKTLFRKISPYPLKNPPAVEPDDLKGPAVPLIGFVPSAVPTPFGTPLPTSPPGPPGGGGF